MALMRMKGVKAPRPPNYFQVSRRCHEREAIRPGWGFFFCICLGFIFLVLGLQEGRKQGRQQQPGRIGRKEGRKEGEREGRKEVITEGGQEGRKEGGRAGRKGRKEGTVYDRIFVDICAGHTGSNVTFAKPQTQTLRP